MKSSNVGSAAARATAALLLVLATLVLAPVSANAQAGSAPDSVVIANRGSGDISVIDVRNLQVETIALPGEAIPMYVNHDPDHDVVYVGDRGASVVHALDDETYEVIASIPVGAGVFHQWLDTRTDQLWVTGTEGATVTAVNTRTMEPITTITIPGELIEAGATTHDVFVFGPHAFVSLVGLDGHGVVLRYSTRTFELTGHIETGGDPHLFVRAGRLYVASQDASTVTTYNPNTLRMIRSADVPTAHGIYVTRDRSVYTTNIAGGGEDALQVLNSKLFPKTQPIDTPDAVPHNVAVARRGAVFITHSGPTANTVSVFEPRTGKVKTVTVGTNPFGLGVIQRG